ncbi:carboxymuconolactone decarboxylase family protein [Burkholderia multivorans]|uniref:carboxymuconolactone decarboxylase family protein n=1 Tax=Burkholderia multivorans TaxID=87883 RepID=UPI0021BFEC6A|nr:carboxymuconolactone decarboxylase family protein [Burkholderia multivorans]
MSSPETSRGAKLSFENTFPDNRAATLLARARADARDTPLRTWCVAAWHDTCIDLRSPMCWKDGCDESSENFAHSEAEARRRASHHVERQKSRFTHRSTRGNDRLRRRPIMEDRPIHSDGTPTRRAVLGDTYVDNALRRDDPFNRPMQQWLTEHVWGGCWASDALPRSTRSLVTLAFLIVLDRADELRLHFRGAIRNGCSVIEIREVLMQAAGYCGAPAAVGAFKIANEVLADEIAALARDA